MLTTAVLVHDCENPLAATGHFHARMAQTLEDVIECQRLRYLVFNCELGEGLDGSSLCGLDRDRFDFACDHLMVHDTATGILAGTYRMQNGYRAKAIWATTVSNSSISAHSNGCVARFWSLEGPAFVSSI